jgi:hypothetical protein
MKVLVKEKKKLVYLFRSHINGKLLQKEAVTNEQQRSCQKGAMTSVIRGLGKMQKGSFTI